ncbi:hypothetical protein [Kitasatospora sp. LaBMicrA B282]|uniref:hypothetical protein n=1 Tax=Kitasatospora sp. LaBMicrA B282 TaxID=3420949 RepID=UPI003D0CA601
MGGWGAAGDGVGDGRSGGGRGRAGARRAAVERAEPLLELRRNAALRRRDGRGACTACAGAVARTGAELQDRLASEPVRHVTDRAHHGQREGAGGRAHPRVLQPDELGPLGELPGGLPERIAGQRPSAVKTTTVRPSPAGGRH